MDIFQRIKKLLPLFLCGIITTTAIYADQYYPVSHVCQGCQTYDDLLRRLESEGVEVIQVGDELKIIIGYDHFFKRSSNTELRPDRDAAMKDITRLVRSRGNVPIIVSGHTDNVGSDRSKLYRSREQANTIASYLWANGIPLGNMTIIGCADTEPVASNKTLDGSTANRRVEIEVPVDP